MCSKLKSINKGCVSHRVKSTVLGAPCAVSCVVSRSQLSGVRGVQTQESLAHHSSQVANSGGV